MPDTLPENAPPSVGTPPLNAVLFGLSDCLVDRDGRLTTGAGQALEHLRRQKVPCAWLDQCEPTLSAQRSAAVPGWVAACNSSSELPWPAAQTCWQALVTVQATALAGCVLVSGSPLLLRAGLAAGLWTVGLAGHEARGELSTGTWLALPGQSRDLRRGKATLALFELGVHSVIDHLEELPYCLQDVGLRWLKGEKP